MKSRKLRARLERLFDQLWERTDRLIRNANPCGHCLIKGHHACNDSKVHMRRALKDPAKVVLNRVIQLEMVCCQHCPHWKRNIGCTADRPLMCRAWLCGSEAQRQPELEKALQVIRDRMHKARLYSLRGDRAAHINVAVESLTIRQKMKSAQSKQIVFA